MVLSCDFLSGDLVLVATTLEGDVNIHSIQEDFRIIRHENILNPHQKSNIAYCCKAVKDNSTEKGIFLIGSEHR